MTDRVATGAMYAAVACFGIVTGIMPGKVVRFLRRGVPETSVSGLQAFRIFAFIVGMIAIVGLVRVLAK